MRLDRDAYFTPRMTSREILNNAIKDEPELLDYEWVEPSAGSGSFLYAAEELGIEIKGYDIHPLREDIIENDFLEDDLDLSGKVVIGNPPYGFKHKLALDFVDRSFEQGAEYVGFLLMGSFATYSNFSRLKSNCEIVAVRKYNVIFENDQSVAAISCLAGRTPSVFVLLKKSETRLKNLDIPNIYSRNTSPLSADFVCGFKFFRNKQNLPEVKPEKTNKGSFYLKNHPRKKQVYFYNSTEVFNTKLINYFQELIFTGDPGPRTLNFYTKYIHVLKDL